MERGHKGQVFFWTNKKRRIGYNLTADSDGVATLLKMTKQAESEKLCEPLTVMPISRDVFIGQVDRNIPLKRPYWPKQLQFRIDNLQASDIHIRASSEEAEVTLSSKGLSLFKDGMEDILQGRGDWAITGTDKADVLWFWPLEPKDIRPRWDPFSK